MLPHQANFKSSLPLAIKPAISSNLTADAQMSPIETGMLTLGTNL